jgi:hypothetical protein
MNVIKMFDLTNVFLLNCDVMLYMDMDLFTHIMPQRMATRKAGPSRLHREESMVYIPKYDESFINYVTLAPDLVHFFPFDDLSKVERVDPIPGTNPVVYNKLSFASLPKLQHKTDLNAHNCANALTPLKYYYTCESMSNNTLAFTKITHLVPKVDDIHMHSSIFDMRREDMLHVHAYMDSCEGSPNTLFVPLEALDHFVTTDLQSLNKTLKYILYIVPITQQRVGEKYQEMLKALLICRWISHMYVANLDLPTHAKLSLLPLGVRDAFVDTIYDTMKSTYYKRRPNAICCYDQDEEIAFHTYKFIYLRDDDVYSHVLWEALYLGCALILQKTDTSTHFIAYLQQLRIPFYVVKHDSEVNESNFNEAMYRQARCMMNPWTLPALKSSTYTVKMHT